MIAAGCAAWMLAATLFPLSAAAESSSAAEKPRGVNHRNEQYDTNKDGQLDQAEIAAMKADRTAKAEAKRLAKYDANKNGVLDPDEESVRQSDLAKRREQRAERKKAKAAEKAAAATDDSAAAEDDEDEVEAVKR